MHTPHKPAYAVGAVVRVSPSAPGHDRDDPKGSVRVTDVYPGADARHTGYKIQGSPSVWPETRLIGR